VKGAKKMKLYLRLAWRNIWRHRGRTIIVVLAIGLTMALMMWYDGMIAGFEQAIYGNAIQVLGGNIQIHAPGYQAEASQMPLLPLENDTAIVEAAKAQPEVLLASRRINTGGMASNRKGAFAANIVGIEPEQEAQVSLLARHISAGRFLTSADQDQAFIGKGLADAMEIGVGDRFTLTGRATHDQMRNRTMTVAGIYDVGLPDIEKRSIYISLAKAQDLYGLPGQSTEVALMLKQIGEEPAVIKAVKSSLPGDYEFATWATNFPELQNAVNTKTGAMNIFSIIILLVVGIGILNLLMMAVFERTREIGILGAIGLKPGQISWLFLLEGMLMGLVGLAFGIVLGLLINIWIGKVGFNFAQYSSLTSYTALISGRVYTTLGTEKLLSRSLTVLVISLLASFFPARAAAQNEPAQALHYV
jgi:ABC-type lipoprotein release transport system permease subunit